MGSERGKRPWLKAIGARSEGSEKGLPGGVFLVCWYPLGQVLDNHHVCRGGCSLKKDRV